MSLVSPKANLYMSLMQRIKTNVPDIRFIARDVGQLENSRSRPAVSWPCSLISFPKTNYSDAQNNFTQLADGLIMIRTGMVQYSDFNNLTPDQWQEKALQFLEIEQKLYQALHGWAPAGFQKLLRRSDGEEQRDDDILVSVLELSVGFTDETAAPVKITIPRPGAVQLL